MTARSKRETRAEKQARTRAELLATAAKVFAQRGYNGASVEQIAEEAGYSHGAVYSNFDGKADLFLAVFEEYMAQRAQELDRQPGRPRRGHVAGVARPCPRRSVDGALCR